MTPAELLDQAREHLDQAIEKVGEAAEGAPAYAVGPMRFLSAEIKVSRRRLENARKVLGGQPHDPAA